MTIKITTLEDYIDNKIIHSSRRTTIEVYFDGLCHPRGIACFGFIIKNGANTIHREYGLAENNSTNNAAEYTGIIKALEWLIANNYQNESIVINGDSQLVIQQIKRNFRVKAPTIIPLYHKAVSLVSKFNHIQFEWIPREQNKEADSLSYFAYTMSYTEPYNEYNNTQEDKSESSEGYSLPPF
jgi:ribonuclease HI